MTKVVYNNNLLDQMTQINVTDNTGLLKFKSKMHNTMAYFNETFLPLRLSTLKYLKETVSSQNNFLPKYQLYAIKFLCSMEHGELNNVIV